jgi:hypothetical protein
MFQKEAGQSGERNCMMDEHVATETSAEGGIKTLDELNNSEVVRSEFLSPKYRPSMTFDFDKIVFNASCIRLFPDTEHVLLLVDREKKRLIALPCSQYTKDAFRWSKTKGVKLQPRHSMSRVFSAKIFDMMNWIPENRYRVQAVYLEIEGQRLIVFNLEECEMVVPEIITLNDGTTVKKRKRYYPHEWRESFGVTFIEHRDTYRVDLNAHFMLNNAASGEESAFAFVKRGHEPTDAEIITRPYTRSLEG